ncbi:hypothetical protein VNO77_46250 [Canavalia gladiata]|uniref:Uncharacterized protein n=1 Tax=Canavalia gladiata TaxID=3824 RepID=A0AAN9JBW2_CANGL
MTGRQLRITSYLLLYYTTRPRLPCSSSSRVKGVAKFVGEVFLDLYDLSEGATRYEWLLKEEAQSKGRLLSSQDTDYRDPNFEIDVAEICLKQPMVCNPLRPRDVEAPPSKPRSSVPFTTSRRSTASESGKADSIVASQPAYSRTSSRGISYDLTKMRFDLGEYLLPQTKAEEGYVLVANTVQRAAYLNTGVKAAPEIGFDPFTSRAIYEPDKAKELRRTSLGQTLVISRRSQLEEAKVDKASESVQNLGGLVGSPKRWALASIRHRQKGSIIRVAAGVPAYEDF